MEPRHSSQPNQSNNAPAIGTVGVRFGKRVRSQLPLRRVVGIIAIVGLIGVVTGAVVTGTVPNQMLLTNGGDSSEVSMSSPTETPTRTITQSPTATSTPTPSPTSSPIPTPMPDKIEITDINVTYEGPSNNPSAKLWIDYKNNRAEEGDEFSITVEMIAPPEGNTQRVYTNMSTFEHSDNYANTRQITIKGHEDSPFSEHMIGDSTYRVLFNGNVWKCNILNGESHCRSIE